MVTQQQLSGYLGKTIAQICPNGYTGEADNHCAHFVAHALGYQFGLTCQVLGSPRGPAATVRIQDLFRHCTRVGVWSLRPSALTRCLVFMTRASNVNLAAKAIAAAPRQRVGLYLDGFVWHYSNSQRKVIRQTPSQFSLHYPAPDNAMFYGLLP